MKINKKYEVLYNEALNKKTPESQEDMEMCCYSEEDGKYMPATPIGFDKEQLEFDALYEVIRTAFTKDKDYVCWSNGGYSKKTDNILETLEGDTLKAYDPVLYLGNFGEPLGFMMFTGEIEEEGNYKKVVFLYLKESEIPTKFKCKVYVPHYEWKCKETKK